MTDYSEQRRFPRLPAEHVVLVKKLGAGDRDDGDAFGSSLAARDGTIFVGAPYDDVELLAYAGSVYRFDRAAGLWPATEDQKLIASGRNSDNLFGSSVSAIDDWLVVGAPRGDGPTQDTGVVYVFADNGSSWIEMDRLLAPDGAAGDQFGAAVAIYRGRLVVGAPGDDDNGPAAGSAYVYFATTDNAGLVFPSDTGMQEIFMNADPVFTKIAQSTGDVPEVVIGLHDPEDGNVMKIRLQILCLQEDQDIVQ